MLTNGTWSLVLVKPDTNIIGCKWVFKVKQRPDGSIERRKARFVAKGFNQQAGIDYNETFSPVVKPVTIRIILTIALSNNWPLRQLDVQNAFLHGDLTEVVYMKQPPGFVDSRFPHYVCRLHKTIYGLKQSPREWNQKLCNFLIDFGFCVSKADPSLLMKLTSTYKIYVLVYVDDLIITRSDSTLVQQTIDKLNTVFAIKDLGDLSYFLGVEATRSKAGLFLSQHKYIVDLLRRTKMDGAAPISTPLCS